MSGKWTRFNFNVKTSKTREKSKRSSVRPTQSFETHKNFIESVFRLINQLMCCDCILFGTTYRCYSIWKRANRWIIDIGTTTATTFATCLQSFKKLCFWMERIHYTCRDLFGIACRIYYNKTTPKWELLLLLLATAMPMWTRNRQVNGIELSNEWLISHQ